MSQLVKDNGNLRRSQNRKRSIARLKFIFFTLLGWASVVAMVFVQKSGMEH